MPAHRKPNALHQLKGSFRGDRHVGYVPTGAPLNRNAPEDFTDAEKTAWNDLLSHGAEHLRAPDHFILELTARLGAIVHKPETPVAKVKLYLTLLDKLGLSTQGRRRLGLPDPISINDGSDDDEFAAFN